MEVADGSGATAEASIERALTLIGVRRWRDAQAELARALAADPGSVVALCLLAACHLELDEPHEARHAARTAARIDPTSAWAHRLRSLALLDLGERPRAIRAARRAVGLAPESPVAHVCLAQAMLGIEGIEQRAHETALRAVELDPASVDARLVLGVAKECLHDRDGAREVYGSALRLDPRDPRTLRLLAEVRMQGGRLRPAVDLLVAALRSDPQDAQARASLDEVAGRLIRRLLVVLVLGGLVVAQMAGSEAADGTVTWWPRGIVGVLVLGFVGRLGWAPWRQVPVSMRPHFDGFAGRLRDRHFVHGCLLVAVTLLVVAMTVLPAPIAQWAGAVLGGTVVVGVVTWYLAGLLGIGLLAGQGVRGAWRLATRRRPGRDG